MALVPLLSLVKHKYVRFERIEDVMRCVRRGGHTQYTSPVRLHSRDLTNAQTGRCGPLWMTLTKDCLLCWLTCLPNE